MHVHVFICSLKLPFRSQLINLLKDIFKKLAYIYYNKCLLQEESVWNLKEKTLHYWFFYFQIACNY